MLKLRVMGTKKEIESFRNFMENEQTAYEIESISRIYRNKGTDMNRRMYADISRKNEKNEVKERRE